jgi:hypothetical protein
MPETSTTDFNDAMRDAKKQAGGVANEVSDAASELFYTGASLRLCSNVSWQAAQ